MDTVLSLGIYDPNKNFHRVLPSEIVSIKSATSSDGFWHGRTGQPTEAAFFHDTWGAAQALEKKNNLSH